MSSEEEDFNENEASSANPSDEINRLIDNTSQANRDVEMAANIVQGNNIQEIRQEAPRMLNQFGGMGANNNLYRNLRTANRYVNSQIPVYREIANAWYEALTRFMSITVELLFKGTPDFLHHQAELGKARFWAAWPHLKVQIEKFFQWMAAFGSFLYEKAQMLFNHINNTLGSFFPWLSEQILEFVRSAQENPKKFICATAAAGVAAGAAYYAGASMKVLIACSSAAGFSVLAAGTLLAWFFS